MLWIDKFRPNSLEKMDFHLKMGERLAKLAESGDIPHLLFHGPSGAGKKTRIMCLLRGIFGAAVDKMKINQREFKTPSKATFELTLFSSNYHTEMNPSEAGFHDRFVVQEIIKEMASSAQVDTTGKKKFKVVLLTEVDKLSRSAQASLRRTMEKYTSSCRLILCSESLTKVIDPVRSRCLCIRVAAPKVDEMVNVMGTVARKGGIRTVEPELLTRIAIASKRNLRRALLMMETMYAVTNTMPADMPIERTDWEKYVQSLAQDIFTEQSPKKLLECRKKLYELLCNCIPADVVLDTLCDELCGRVDSELKPDVVEWAAHYDHRLQLGNKDIFHLEAFVAKIMALCKRYTVSIMRG